MTVLNENYWEILFTQSGKNYSWNINQMSLDNGDEKKL